MIRLTNDAERQRLIESLCLALGAELVAIHRHLPDSYFSDPTSQCDMYDLGSFGSFQDAPTEF